jgi:integrase/recombinase XerC
MLTRFLKYLQVEKNYSAQTLRAYGDDLRQFFAYCGIDPHSETIPTLGHRTIRAWLSHLLASGITPRSVNRKLSSLRGFYRYMSKVEACSDNPLQKVVAPKMSKKLPVFLNNTEANNMLEPDKFPEGFFGLRDLTVISLFYFTGIRVSEMAGLETKNVNLNSLTIKVMGKGSKERLIPLHPELMEILKMYFEQKTQLFPSNQTPYLIINNTGKKSYPKMLYRIVNKYLSLVTPLEKKSPHVLRHTFATHLLNQGADINAIKELLGHANLSATQIYTHTSVQKLKEAYKQAHPRA